MSYTEGKPWTEIDGETGALNISSYTAIAMFGITGAAVETLDKAGLKLTGPMVRQLARVFLSICDEVQAQLRPDESVDWNAGSHTRVRGAFHTVLNTMPPPLVDEDGKPAKLEALMEWRTLAAKRALAISQVAVSLWAEGVGENPCEELVEIIESSLTTS